MTAIEDARVALTEMERIGTDGWCLCVSSSAQSKVESALRALIAEHERLTTHDAQCEAEYIAEAPGWTDCGCRDRLTTPPTADERETLADVIQAAMNERFDIGHIADAILASDVWRNRRQGPITDDEADRANQAFHEYGFGPGKPLTRRELGITRQAWKAALKAARDTP